jgi:hypothetical protein
MIVRGNGNFSRVYKIRKTERFIIDKMQEEFISIGLTAKAASEVVNNAALAAELSRVIKEAGAKAKGLKILHEFAVENINGNVSKTVAFFFFFRFSQDRLEIRAQLCSSTYLLIRSRRPNKSKPQLSS